MDANIFPTMVELTVFINRLFQSHFTDRYCKPFTNVAAYRARVFHKITGLHRVITHLESVVLPSVQPDTIRTNSDLRVRYLTHDIDEKKWLSLLQHREERRIKLQTYAWVTQLAVERGKEKIQQFVHEAFNVFRRHPSMEDTVEETPEDIRAEYDKANGFISTTFQDIRKFYFWLETELENIKNVYGGGYPKQWRHFLKDTPFHLIHNGHNGNYNGNYNGYNGYNRNYNAYYEGNGYNL
jgi:hypothetical protein